MNTARQLQYDASLGNSVCTYLMTTSDSAIFIQRIIQLLSLHGLSIPLGVLSGIYDQLTTAVSDLVRGSFEVIAW